MNGPTCLIGTAGIRARQAILNFKYWMDEPGHDSMCYWSENHQILFAACEYLAGQLYPNEIFSNDGRKGKEKQERARIRIERLDGIPLPLRVHRVALQRLLRGGYSAPDHPY